MIIAMVRCGVEVCQKSRILLFDFGGFGLVFKKIGREMILVDMKRYFRERYKKPFREVWYDEIDSGTSFEYIELVDYLSIRNNCSSTKIGKEFWNLIKIFPQYNDFVFELG